MQAHLRIAARYRADPAILDGPNPQFVIGAGKQGKVLGETNS